MPTLAKTIKEFLELVWISGLGLERGSCFCRCREYSGLFR